MPTPKVKRTIGLLSSSATSDVALLNLVMEASFTTGNTVDTANVIEDTSVTSDESTEYKMSFSTAAGPIGAVTISFVAGGEDLASGISVSKPTASTTSLPRATTSTVTPIATPDAYFERVWQQPALAGSTEVVDQVAGLDVRVKAETGYTVTQTVTSRDDDDLVLTYQWANVAGSLVTGTVNLQATSEARGTYTLGTVSVTDDPAAPAARGTRETRKTLRERLKAVARELRERRRELKHGGKHRVA